MSQGNQRCGKYGRLGLISVFVILAVSACQNSQTSQQAKPDMSSTTTSWQVSLNISGGLKGISQTITIDDQGVSQFTDHFTQTQKNSQISTESLNKLAELVKNYSFTPKTKDSKSISCRDCLNYIINVKYGGEVSRQTVSNLNVGENLKSLIATLKAISSELAQQSK